MQLGENQSKGLKTMPSLRLIGAHMKTNLTLMAVFVWLLHAVNAVAQGTAFTYQGRLGDNGTAANGSYDLTFALFTVSSGAGQVGLTQTHTAVGVSNGLFTVKLDFGAS